MTVSVAMLSATPPCTQPEPAPGCFSAMLRKWRPRKVHTLQPLQQGFFPDKSDAQQRMLHA